VRHPVPGADISQRFGENPGTYAQYGLAGHEGLDLAAPVGTPVRAAHDGEAQGHLGSSTYGHYVQIVTPTLETVYAHLSDVVVRDGQAVRAGDVIGLSGNTGRSFGPHLHFGVRPLPADAGNGYKGWVDPERFLREEGDMGLIGWHLGNGSPPTDVDWRILEAVPPRCVVFLPDEGTQPEHLQRLLGIAPQCHVIMRPYYVPGSDLQAYIDQCRRAMDHYWPVVPAAQRHLQLFNEPNMPVWAQWEGFGDQLNDMRRFDEWFVAAYSQCKRQDPATAIGWTPLTPGNRDVWFTGDAVGHYYLHGPSGCAESLTEAQRQQAVAEGPCQASIALADEFYAHVYVHEGRDAYEASWLGLRFERYRRFLPTGKPLWITEAGFPSRAAWPDWGDAALIDWLNMIRDRDVQGVALWILGDKPQWGAPWYEGSAPRSLVWTLAQWQQSAPIDVEAVIGEAAQAHILPLNPAAAFERAAALRCLLPASREFDVAVGGATYRAQAYRGSDDRERQHIVYCPIGDWSDLRWFDRLN